jgi:hypothetical protein
VGFVPPRLFVARDVWRGFMENQATQKRKYTILAALFTVAGAIWIVYGFFSPRFILYPLIGVANLGVAYVCRKLST